MQRRKGFTLVELVIVIAVIAILAGVLIGTFASVLNKANESAKMQELKAQEHEQKANDLLKKIEDSNWYGWEDFETSIVDKLTKVYKENSGSTPVTTAEIQKVVKDALVEYAQSQASDKTQLTEEQVKVIVEDAIGKIKYNGVTEAQVKAIVSAAATSVQGSQLSAAQVKSIVNAAQEKNLTANDVARVIANANLATTTNVNSAVQTIISAIETASASALTTEDLANAIVDLLPVTYKVANQAAVTAALQKVNSFSTLNFTSNFAATISTDKNITLTISGVKLNNLTIDAPFATIYVITDEGTINVTSVADKSLHISGEVEELNIKQGRAVVEEGGKVETLTAAPTKNQVIAVEVESGAEVKTFNLKLQKNTTTSELAAETVTLANRGTVGTTNVDAVAGENTISTNVVVTESVGNDAQKIVKSAAENKAAVVVVDTVEEVKYEVTVSGETADVNTTPDIDTTPTLTKSGDTYLVRSSDELRLVAALVNGDVASWRSASYVLTANVDISDKTWEPIGKDYDHIFTGSFDGDENTISGLTNYASYEYSGIFFETDTTKNYAFGLFGVVQGSGTIKDLSLEDVNTKLPMYGIGGGLIATLQSGYKKNGEGKNYITTQLENYTIDTVTVSGNITAWDCAGALAGRVNYRQGGSGAKVTVNSCTNNANISAYRADTLDNVIYSYARAGALFGYYDHAGGGTIANCTNTGTISCYDGYHDWDTPSKPGIKYYVADNVFTWQKPDDCVEIGDGNKNSGELVHTKNGVR